MSNLNRFLDQVREFRSLTGLPMNSSDKVLKASSACSIEELSEVADALGDSVVTILGIALQCKNDEIIDTCMDYVRKIEFAAEILNIDLTVAMDKIQSANLSKLCDTKEEAIETEVMYTMSGIDSYIEPVDDKFAVYSEFDQRDCSGKYYPKGKLLKNINWFEPDYSDSKEWFKDKEMLEVLTEDLE